MSATAAALAAGTDTIGVTVLVGGVSYGATLAIEVNAAPQTLGSVQITPTVV